MAIDTDAEVIHGLDVLPWDSKFVAVSKRPPDFQAVPIQFWWKEMLACDLRGRRYLLQWYPGIRSIILINEHGDTYWRFAENSTVVFEYEQWVARSAVW